MGKSLDWLQNKKVDALVSAGNTGALMALSKFKLRTLTGISRPAIATTIPHANGEFVMLDLGANVDCNRENLIQFAIMGSEFAKVVLGKRNPKNWNFKCRNRTREGKNYLTRCLKYLKIVI